MLPRNRGHIVQMSSVAGAIPFPGLAAYAGSKAGLTNFSETLRLELKHTDIGITVVSPGPVDTEMWEPTFERLGEDAVREGFAKRVPMARWGTADEIADAASTADEAVVTSATISVRSLI